MSEPLYRSRPGGFQIQPASEGTRKINDFIHLSEGLSNAWLVVTPEGRVVINTGMGFESPVHKRNFDAIDSGPVRYIVLTQGHVDHVGGVDLLREPGTQLVAQANNPPHQEDDSRIAAFRGRRSAFAFGPAIAKANAYIREHLGEKIAPQSKPVPDVTFEDTHAFELGGVQFELLATPGGETTDSLVVWLPQHKICFAGNLFSALFGHFPNLVTIRGDRYREALKFVASLDRVLALEPELLCVGHHDPIEGKERIREELLRLRGAVMHVHDETVRGMNQGKDVHTLMREITLPPELEVGEGYGKVSWSVRAIWETYAGWFHHRSVTELYDVPAESVHADLVELAGGPEAVAKRAQEKLAAGSPVEAVHLAEVALAAAPDHAASLQASLAAHERLEQESENFWLTSWIRKKQGELRAALDGREG
jgi:alkyl sulfatase BDS1-like metallo-beta-lactamase superfamily hydrolase